MIEKMHEAPSFMSGGRGSSLRMINKGVLISGVAGAVCMLWAAPAHAYIDPGTGSMLVQAIAASVLTAGAMVSVFWKAIKNFFLNIGKRRKDDIAKNSRAASR